MLWLAACPAPVFPSSSPCMRGGACLLLLAVQSTGIPCLTKRSSALCVDVLLAEIAAGCMTLGSYDHLYHNRVLANVSKFRSSLQAFHVERATQTVSGSTSLASGDCPAGSPGLPHEL